MNKIKVLHLYKTSHLDTYGGVEKFIEDITNNDLLKDIAKLYVLTFSKKNKKLEIRKINKVIFIIVPNFLTINSLPLSLKFIFVFLNIFKKFDMFHIHYPFPYADILSAFIKKKILITYHSDIVRQKYSKLFLVLFKKILFTKAHKIIFTSNTYLINSDLSDKYKSKATYINLSLDILKYNSDLIDKNYKLPFDKFFLFIGNFRNYKGLDLLIKAFNITNLNLIIAGTENLSQKKLKKMIKKDNIKIITNLSDSYKKYLLKNCYSFILSSTLKSEAFGYVLLEACYYSKPLITFNINTGVNEINIDKYTGLVCKKIDVDSLVDATQFINQNPNKAILYGKNAKRHFNENFSFDKMISKYKIYYLN